MHTVVILPCLFSRPIHNSYNFGYSCCVYSPDPFTTATSLVILAVFILPTHSQQLQFWLFLLCLFSRPIHNRYKFGYSCYVYSPDPFTTDTSLVILAVFILPTHSQQLQGWLFLLCLFSRPIHNSYMFSYSCYVYSPDPFTTATRLVILAMFILPTHSQQLHV